jgi:hypothetical protein
MFLSSLEIIKIPNKCKEDRKDQGLKKLIDSYKIKLHKNH